MTDLLVSFGPIGVVSVLGTALAAGVLERWLRFGPSRNRPKSGPSPAPRSVESHVLRRAVLALTSRTVPEEMAEWLVRQPGIDLHALARSAPAESAVVAGMRKFDEAEIEPRPSNLTSEERDGVRIEHPSGPRFAGDQAMAPLRTPRPPWKDPEAVAEVERAIADSSLTGVAAAQAMHEIMRRPEAAALSNEDGITPDDVAALEHIVELMESGQITRAEAQRYTDGWPYTRPRRATQGGTH